MRHVLILAAVFLLSPRTAQAATFRVTSPSGNTAIVLEVAKSALRYRVLFDGKPVVKPSRMQWRLAATEPVGPALRVLGQRQRTIDETWSSVTGKSSRIRDRARELEISLRDRIGRLLILTLRAYDDGVAFRYAFPEQPALPELTIESEDIEVGLAPGLPMWAANYGALASPQEQEFRRTQTDQLPLDAIFGLPLLVQAGPKAWLAVTESDLLDWAGLYLRPSKGKNSALETVLSPLPSAPGIAVKAGSRRISPWRVFMLAKTPGGLVQSELVRNLATPNQLADISWVKPGRSAWDRWWPGDHNPNATNKQGMNTATMKDYIDLAAEMGWEYQIVDWTWYGKPSRPDADLTKVVAELDLPAVIAHARSRNVGVWLWARWNHMNDQMDKALPLFRRWGVVGIKVDFMDRDDQEMVNFYTRLVKLAAENKLMVDLHGAYKPTGLERTYPNLLTREGVLGNEYNKWSNRVTPMHKVTLAFTRMLAGPMDFTPGGFRHAQPGSFVAKDVAPEVQGTRAAELALPVIYESGLQVFCDAPGEYRAAPETGASFLAKVPAAWDETRVLGGEPDAYIVVARRSGDTWFGGAITTTERRIDVSLGFLGTGSYEMELWHDAPESQQKPASVLLKRAQVTAKDRLEVSLVHAGGAAFVIRPAGR